MRIIVDARLSNFIVEVYLSQQTKLALFGWWSNRISLRTLQIISCITIWLFKKRWHVTVKMYFKFYQIPVHKDWSVEKDEALRCSRWKSFRTRYWNHMWGLQGVILNEFGHTGLRITIQINKSMTRLACSGRSWIYRTAARKSSREGAWFEPLPFLRPKLHERRLWLEGCLIC